SLPTGPRTCGRDCWTRARTPVSFPPGWERATRCASRRRCVYGNDMDETTTLVEAGLGWIVSLDEGKGDFVGRGVLEAQKREGAARKLVGFEMVYRGIARHGYPVYVGDEPSGSVTSGCYAPFL